jgi:serpin B
MVIRKNLLFVFCILLLSCFSCKKSGESPAKGINLVLTPVERQQVSADNAFTLKLFKNIDSAATGNVNLFISPLSVSLAISMTSNGSNGQTLAAMMNSLNFSGFTESQVNSYYNTLITDLPKLDPATTLKIANSIWYNNSFNVLPQFLQTNGNFYNAKIQALNFSDPAAANTINNWVSTQTNGNITSIINGISPDALMYLINAIYFKSSWNERFDPSLTNKQPFILPDNSTVQADFMFNSTLHFKSYNDAEAGVYELPYVNNKYSMVIIEPTAGNTVQQLIAGMDTTKWKTWMAGLNSESGSFKMPKFKFGYSLSLKNALTTLGMGIAFSSNADFSRLNANGGLSISDVQHKAYVDVDENGTTAAAVTSVVITSVALQGVVISRPFVFAIRETSSGLILFTGVVNNPLLSGN